MDTMWGLPDPSRLYGNQRALYKGSLYAGIYQRSVCWRTQYIDGHPAPDFCERLCQFPVCITGNGPIGRCIGKNRTGASCKIFWHCILVDHPGKRDPYRRRQYLSDGISGRIQLYSRPENRTASSVCRFFECVDSIDCSPCPYKVSPSGGSSSGRVSLGAVRNFSAILSGRNQGSMECDRSTRNG